MKHVAFFGDGERTFALPPELILELERKIGVGIGAIFKRVLDRTFGIRDVTETIRLGLVGGGTAPAEAAALVAAYVEKRPLAETYPLALAVLSVAWFGDVTEEEPGNE